MDNRLNLNRRNFLKLAGITGTLSFASDIIGWSDVNGKNSILQDDSDFDVKLAPVNISSDRVIRTVVGLRPFRPSGFVIKTEKIENKLVVHNYGHGGGGISLSWGSAVLAVEKVLDPDESEIAVVGCGVIGLSTALLLQLKGFKVTIYAREIPPGTTSDVAGALWGPVSVFDQDKAGSEFLNQFYRASKISYRVFQDLLDDKYGVRWIKNYSLGKAFNFPGGRDLYPEVKKHNNPQIYFSYADVEEIMTIMIETPTYMKALMEDFTLAGGKIEIMTFNSIQDCTALQEKIIMNCTGLGAGKLFNDKELIPVKGQLSILLPQPEIDYSYVSFTDNNLLYMLPRKDGIILGGTHDKGNWSLEPDDPESSRILKGHSLIADSIKG